MTPRLLIYTPQDEAVGEVSPLDTFSRVRTETLNGQTCLDVTLTRPLERNQRLLTRDAMGKWHEWVVVGIDQEHQEHQRPIGTYHCIWSVQHDLEVTVVSEMPGVKTPVMASVALESALSGTSRWQAGTVTQATSGGASMYMISGWEALGVLTDVWGGEIEPDISVDENGVVSRKVNLKAQRGKKQVTRRFDWKADLTSITRRVDDSPVACRIVPRGKGEETEGGGYGRKITIEDVNGGKNYLRNQSAERIYRLPDGKGGWEYPTVFADNDQIDDKQKLKEWGQSVINRYTTPQVTYSASVLQFSDAGMNAQGVALGDPVQCVDYGFGDTPLRIEGRVVKMVVNELNAKDVQLTIGYLKEGIPSQLKSLTSKVASARMTIDALAQGSQTMADFLEDVLGALNRQINANGGWTYITDGQGLRTYDREVSDPLVGAEATQVVELKGGSIRVANSRTSSGDWDWRTVIVSGHIAADMVTAARLETGFIGDVNGNFWDLDSGSMRMATIAVYNDDTGQYDDLVDIAKTAKTDAAKAQSTADKAKKRQVGGRNLLHGTSSFENWRAFGIDEYQTWVLPSDLSSASRGIRGDSEYAEAYNSKAASPGWEICLKSPSKTIRAEDVEGRRMTLSFDVKPPGTYDYIWPVADDNAFWVSVVLVDGQGNRKKWRDIRVNERIAADSEHRIALSFTLDNKFLSSGGTSITSFNGLDLEVWFYNRSHIFVNLARVQLELGDVATEWTSKVLDLRKEAGKLAEEALDKSKTYTETISESDRAFTREQRQLLDDSYTQAKILDRLTNGGRAQGMFTEDGQLYINATYVKSGTLDAKVLKAGIIVDRLERNKWDLERGYFETKNAVMQNAQVTGTFTSGDIGNGPKIVVKDGQIWGYKSTKSNDYTGYINLVKGMYDRYANRNYNGWTIAAPAIMLRADRMAVGDRSLEDSGTFAWTGVLTVESVESIDITNGSYRVKCVYFELHFKNGICTGIFKKRANAGEPWHDVSTKG